jgi:hypothetical protein
LTLKWARVVWESYTPLRAVVSEVLITVAQVEVLIQMAPSLPTAVFVISVRNRLMVTI